MRLNRRAAAAVMVLVALGTGAAAPVEAKPAQVGGPVVSWAIDADSMRIANAQEDGWFPEDGDEPLLSVVAFRTRPGVRGTTQVWRLSGFTELCSGADGGDVCGIGDNVGRANFGAVALGEVIGTIQVTIEDDHTPRSSLNRALDDAVNAVRPALTALSESITAADILNPSALGPRLDSLIATVRRPSNLAWYEQLFQSVFGSDNVDLWVTLLVNAGGPQAREATNWALLAAFYKPGSVVAAAALERRTWVLDHRTEGTHYDVTTHVQCAAPISVGIDPPMCV